jgi:hypothetical protein
MANRNDLLRSIVNDPASTESERVAAQKELGECPISDDALDRELESYLAIRNIHHGSIDKPALRCGLSPASQQLLNDLDAITLVVARPGVEERLLALLETTKSELVKEHVLAALSTIDWLKETGRLTNATFA